MKVRFPPSRDFFAFYQLQLTLFSFFFRRLLNLADAKALAEKRARKAAEAAAAGGGGK